MKSGLLLVNLGTPGEATPEAVGNYLNEFLMDPYVIDIPKVLRWILVKLLIVPRRKFLSAEAYKTIWTSRGSPLRFHLEDLTSAVKRELGPTWVVESGMRYGQPSIRKGLENLRAAGVERLVVLPLYPQYAESSSRSSIEKVNAEILAMEWKINRKTIQSFHDEPKHIDAWVQRLLPTMDRLHDPTAHVLFSYHGLPERHLSKSDPTGAYCLDSNYSCCKKALKMKCQANLTCYRAQALQTTHLISDQLGLRPEQWSISFQSRLGRTPWIQPFTDNVVPALANRGVKRLIVVTPSFVADCLETIEEIGDRARILFSEAGGTEFVRIECLNSQPAWVSAVADLAKRS